MKTWMIGAAAMVALTGCGRSERALEGVAPADAAAVYALDAGGARFDAEDAAGAFRVTLGTNDAVHLYVDLTDGRTGTLVFDDGQGSMRSDIPAFRGLIDLGELTVVDEVAMAPDVVSEVNPLMFVDSDGDGTDDLADDDDDGDGVDDAHDTDDDGDGEADDHGEDEGDETGDDDGDDGDETGDDHGDDGDETGDDHGDETGDDHGDDGEGDDTGDDHGGHGDDDTGFDDHGGDDDGHDDDTGFDDHDTGDDDTGFDDHDTGDDDTGDDH